MSTDDPRVTATIDQIGQPVAARIEALLDEELSRWSLLDETLAEPLNSLKQLVLAGGKRLRPAFCYWTYVGAGGDPDDSAIVDAGAALELLHSFALVHDDVMDDSRQRRGNDSVHVQFEKTHANESLGGEARRFGEGVAILVGDMAFVYADLFNEDGHRASQSTFLRNCASNSTSANFLTCPLRQGRKQQSKWPTRLPTTSPASTPSSARCT